MMTERMFTLANSKTKMLILSAVFLGFAFLLNQWQNQLEAGVSRLAREYRVDQDLSKRKAEHTRVYQAVLGSAKLPSQKPFRQNEWVQLAQGLAAGRELSLKELKPVYRHEKRGGKVADIFLILEGPVSELIQFLYRVAKSDDLVYVEKMMIHQSDEQSGVVQAQITLAQAQGRRV